MIATVLLVLLGWAMGVALGYFWRHLNGDSPGEPKPKECAHEYCSSKADPRCAGANCTYHCTSVLGCNERCLDTWLKSEKASDIALKVIARARAK